MTKNNLAASAALTVVAFVLPAQAQHRQLGPHEHGHGTLNIAIEGNKVAIELDVPGADIAGFEHEAKTTEDKAELAKAEANLKQALKLFVLPSAASCKLAKAEVKEEAEHEDDKGAHEDHDHKEGAHHFDYNAAYELECAKPKKIESIQFSYFKVFPNARSLTVNLVSDQQQGSYEVTAEKPHLDLTGSM